ncbi:MAG: ABC transporter permease [Candidatus Auribacterota bacterium]
MTSKKTNSVSILEQLSQVIITQIQHVTSFSGLFYRTLKLVLAGIFHPGRTFNILHLTQQMYHMGIGSLPIVMLTSLFLGMTLAMLALYALSDFGTEIWVAGLVGVGFTRELGPLITAIVVAGRVGASISAELGTMQVSEEVDALETMGINPIRYLILPRFLALVIMLPCLTIVSDYLGIAGGFLIAKLKLGMSFYYYEELTLEFVKTKDIVTGLIKSVSFAMIISMIGCYQGVIVSGGAEGVGQGTTRAVVNSLIFVIAADCIFTALFSYVFV